LRQVLQHLGTLAFLQRHLAEGSQQVGIGMHPGIGGCPQSLLRDFGELFHSCLF
jgi:hypothetical protein